MAPVLGKQLIYRTTNIRGLKENSKRSELMYKRDFADGEWRLSRVLLQKREKHTMPMLRRGSICRF
jgi:hypothetical protein